MSTSIFLSEKHKEAYLEALEEGSIEVCQSRLMLVGHGGAGKTNLKLCLLGEEFVEEHIPTTGVDADPSKAKVEICQAADWELQTSTI